MRSLLTWFFAALLLSGPLGACVAADTASQGGSRSTLVADPNVATVGGNAQVTLIVTARDVAGAPLADRQVTLSCDDASATLSQPPATDASGVTRGAVTRAVPGTVQVRASFLDSGRRIELPGLATVQFVAASAPAAQPPAIALTLTPEKAVANGQSAARVTLAVTGDARPLAGSLVSLKAGSARDSLEAAQGVLDANGQFATAMRSTLAGARVLRAEVGALSAEASYLFVAGPGDPAHSRLQVEPRVAGGDGTDAFIVRIGLFDAFDNPAADELVDITSPVAGTTFVPSRATSDANGQVVVTMSSTALGAVPIVATLRGPADANATSLPGTAGPAPSSGNAATFGMLNGAATFTVGAPTAARSTLTGPTQATVADDQSSAPLRLVLRDAAGHPVAGQAATLITSNLYGNDTFTSSFGPTDVAGTATTTLRSNRAEVKTLTASAAGVSVSAAVTFVAGPADLGKSWLTASPNVVAVDDANGCTLSVRARDAFGNAAFGTAVSFSAQGTNVTLSPTGATADAAGGASSVARSTLAQDVNVTAGLAGLGNLTVSLRFAAGVPQRLTLAASPNTATNDGSFELNLSGAAYDTYNNVVPGAAVYFVSSGGNTHVVPSPAVTDANGQFVATVSSTRAQQQTVTASAGAGAANVVVTFTAATAASAQSSVTFSPASGTLADGSSTALATATFRSADGSLVINRPVTFSSTLPELSFSPNQVLTDGNGQAKIAVSSRLVGSKKFSATQGNVTVSGTVSYAFVPGKPVTALRLSDLPSPSTPTITAYASAAADINGDGWPDYMVAYDNGAQMLSFINQGNGIFAAPIYTSALSQTRNIVAADFTGDGIVDVVLTGDSDRQAALFSGLGQGVFASAAQVLLTSTGGCFGAATADFNEDGLADLVVSCQDAIGLRILLQQPNGTLAMASTRAVPGAATKLAVGDVDHDGHVDIVSANGLSPNVQVFWGAGDGSFSAAQNVSSGADNSSAVALLDANGDGRLDIALLPASGSSTSAYVVLAAAGRTFTPPVSYPVGLTDYGPIVAVDFDQDGIVDLVAGNSASGGASVLLGVGNGNFRAAPARYAVGNQWTASLAVADFDRDGRLDWAAAGPGPALRAFSFVSYGQPNGIGPTTVPVGTQPQSLTAADVNGDGFVDVVSCDVGSKTVSVVLNQNGQLLQSSNYALLGSPSGAPAVGDVDGDGIVDLVVANAAAGNASLLRGMGNGSFAAAIPLALGIATQGVVLQDLTGDGTLDLVIANVDSGATAFVGDGTGSFASPRALAANAIVYGLSLADVNGDGVADVVANSNAGLLYWQGLGNANFRLVDALGPSGRQGAPGVSPGVGDVNGDGFADVVLTDFYSNLTYVYLGRASGNPPLMRASDVYLTGNAAWSRGARLLDVNGDGLLDLVVASGFGSSLHFYQGSGTGAFTFRGVYAAPPDVYDIAVADFDRDGRMDFVVGADNTRDYSFPPKTDYVSFYKNIGAPPLPAGRPLALTSSWSVLPSSQTTDGNATVTISATVSDVFDTRVANYPVTLTASGIDNVFGATSGTTSATGTFSTTLRSKAAQTQTVVLRAGLATLPFTISFTPGVPNAANSSLSLTPNTAAVGPNDTVGVTVLVRDTQGNLVPSSNVSFVADGANNTFAASSGTTDANGRFATTLSSTRAQTESVTVTLAGGASLASNATFTPGSPNAATSSLTASPNVVVADNAASAILTALVSDAYGNPLANQSVTLTSNNASGNDTLTLDANVTDANGRVTGSWKSNRAETKVATLGVGATSVATTVAFLAGAAVSGRSTLSATPNTVAADGQSAAVVRAVLVDAFGNVGAGQQASLQASDANVAFAPVGPYAADANGSFFANVTDAVVQTANVTLVQGNVQLAATALNFTIGPPSAATSVLTASPNAGLVANGAQQASLAGAVRDAMGRPLHNWQVLLSVDSLGTTSPRQVASNGNGAFTASLASRKAGVSQAVALVGNVALRANVTFSATTPTCSGNYLMPVPPMALVSPVGNSPTAAICLAHFDADAYPDAIVAAISSASNNVSVIHGSANGLTNAGVQGFTVPGTPVALALTDVDRNGQLDIVVASQPSQFAVVRNGGAVDTYSWTYTNRGLCQGDVDGDTYPDLVLLAASPNSGYGVARNAGNGNFLPPGYTALGTALTGCALVDVDADGKLDLVLLDQNNRIWLQQGLGNGNFASWPSLPGACAYAFDALAVDDLDGDGLVDVAATCFSAEWDPSTSYVHWWHNAGAGSFAAPTKLQSYFPAAQLRVLDITGDGNLDLVVGARNGHVLTFAGNGNGSFGAPQVVGLTSSLTAFDAADLQQNGNVDLVVGADSPSVNVVYATEKGVFPSMTSRPTPNQALAFLSAPHKLVALGDINGDGLADFAKLSWNDPPLITLSAGDFNYTGPSFWANSPDPTFAAAAGDFFGSGIRTLVQGGFYNNHLCVFPNAGDGMVTSCTQPASLGTITRYVDLAAADINSDGIDDVVALTQGGPTPVFTFFSLGDGNFQLGPAVDPAGTMADPVNFETSVQLVDVDNDGRPDLVVSTYANIYVWKNAGGGSFFAKQTLPMAHFRDYPARRLPSLGDINGDGYADIVSSSQYDTPAIFLNDGSGSFFLSNVPSAGGQCPTVFVTLLLDVDQDGKLDLISTQRCYNQTWIQLQKGVGDGTFAAAAAIYPAQEAILLVGGVGSSTGAPVFVTGNVNSYNQVYWTPSACAP